MKTITLSPSGKKVTCEDGQTVLAALEKGGYFLPNNCRAGACGECKVKVLKGKIDQGFILDMALSREERENGLGLMCMAKILDDELEIEFETNNSLPKLPTPTEQLPFMLTEKLMVTPTIVRLRLRPLATALKFWPGQYVTFGNLEKNIPERSYSIANCPNPDGELVFYITRSAQGLTSNWIHNELQAGDLIKINGPYGTFIGNPQSELPVLCLANGSGLAPIMSLATAALMRGGFKYPATILFSARTKADLFDLGNFKFLEKKFRNFRFVPTLTQEHDTQYKTGRVTELLPQMFPDLQYYSVYIAGSKEFVKDTKIKVLELGGKEDQIYQESFQ